MERRYQRGQGLELRSADSTEAVLTGYAAVFDEDSRNLGGFVERIAPGAFDAALTAVDESRAVLGLWNHNEDVLLGSTSNGTSSL